MCNQIKNKELTIEILSELLNYNPDTGLFTWKHRDRKWFKAERDFKRWNNRHANKHALDTNSLGYKLGYIFYRRYLAHRVAFAIHHGYWPTDQIDHINRDRSDNRIENLRAVSNAENMKNLSMHKNNTSGVMGVYWSITTKKWYVQINVDGKKKHLGYFVDKQDAIQARKNAEIKYGYHENHGRNSAISCVRVI